MGVAGATILQVVPELSAGGAERTTIEVAEALTRAGARALVASAGGRLESELARAGGTLIRMPSIGTRNPLQASRNTSALADLVGKEGVSLIHARSRAPAWPALWAARRTRTPFVTTYHGIYNARNPAKRLYNSVMARGDAVIANSEFTAAHVRTQHAFARERLVTIPRGVDLARFSREAVSGERLSKLAGEWGVARGDGGPFVILLPARLTGWKGQREAIDAAARLSKRLAGPWTLLLAGDAQGRDSYLQELHAQIARHDLDAHVRIVGHCSDMPAAFALADLVVAPSNEPEAFGRVAAEAGAMGVAVIGSDMGGQKEVIVDKVTGLLTPAGDPARLADAIALLAQGPRETLRAMGEAARLRIRETYSVTALQSATLSVYERLLGRRHV